MVARGEVVTVVVERAAVARDGAGRGGADPELHAR